MAAGLLSFWSVGHGETVVKAQTDECYDGIDGDYEEKLDGVACQDGWLEKRNQSDGWALTSSGKDVWVGIGANVSCIAATAGSIFAGVIHSFQATPFPASPAFSSPFGFLLACERPEGQYLYEKFLGIAPLIDRLTGSLLGIIGDWRPPEVWLHDTTVGGRITRKSSSRIPATTTRSGFAPPAPRTASC